MGSKTTFPPVDEQLELVLRGCVECYSKEDLKKRMEASAKAGKPLRVKLGLDPTRPDIHVGHTVVLSKLRQFQDLGHKAVLIIGDYTAMVGDPSGRSKTRQTQSRKEIEDAAKTYFDQVADIIDVKAAEVRYNGEWFSEMSFTEVMHLAGKVTVARILERDDFSTRFKSQTPISMHEMFYPLMQAYDSVAIEADVELGGTDQTFNLLLGRRLLGDMEKPAQICMTYPLLVGLDGKEKMSKSLGNTGDIQENPDEMFGKTMSIADNQMENWFTLVTDVPMDEVKVLCDPDKTSPRESKDRLARAIVARFHGDEAAQKASDEFVRRFRDKGLPDDIPGHKPSAPKLGVVELLIEVGFVKSRSEARRAIEQKGVRLIDSSVSSDGEVIEDLGAEIETQAGLILRFGKRRFVRFE